MVPVTPKSGYSLTPLSVVPEPFNWGPNRKSLGILLEVVQESKYAPKAPKKP